MLGEQSYLDRHRPLNPHQRYIAAAGAISDQLNSADVCCGLVPMVKILFDER